MLDSPLHRQYSGYNGQHLGTSASSRRAWIWLSGMLEMMSQARHGCAHCPCQSMNELERVALSALCTGCLHVR